MNKQEFLNALKKSLSSLPNGEVEERLGFYSEMIDDYIEEGITETEAVARIGAVEDVVAQCTEQRKNPSRKLTVWKWVLLIAGSPIWISLLASVAAVAAALYAVLWSGIVCLWAAKVALIGTALGGTVMSVVAFSSDNALVGWAMVGTTIFCVGVAIFLFYGCKAASKGAWYLTKQFPRWVKALFHDKEGTL